MAFLNRDPLSPRGRVVTNVMLFIRFKYLGWITSPADA